MMTRLFVSFCFVAFLSSCAIYKVITQPVYVSNVGDRYETIVEKTGVPISTFSINDKGFVKFDENEILYFENGVLKKKFEVEDNQHYRVDVDSLTSNQNLKFKTVKIIPNMPGITSNDLAFKNFKKQIELILKEKDLLFVESDKDADIILGVAYGISDPQVEIKTISSPVWGYDLGKVINSSISSGYGHNVNVQTTIPGQGLYVAGQQTQTYNLTTYNRYVTLKGIDGKAFLKNKEIVELFRYAANSIGQSDDLRLLLPPLITPAVIWFNKDSQQKVKYEINDADLWVWVLRNWEKFN